MLIIGEVKIRHSGDMSSSSRWAALYQGFLGQTVARVTVTTLLRRGYTVNEIVLCAPTRPDDRYEKEQVSIAPSAPASAGGIAMQVGGPGEWTYSYRARGNDT